VNSYLRVLLAGFRSAHQILSGDLRGAHESILAMTPIAEGGGFDAGPWQGPGRAVIWHQQGRLPELLAGLEAAAPGFKSFAGPCSRSATPTQAVTTKRSSCCAG
jgi:hypothetical protein